jgi:spore germination protein YaaH
MNAGWLLTYLDMRRLVIFFLLAAGTLAARPKALFYLTRDPAGVQSFLAHWNKIDILAPDWYATDAAGNVTGRIDTTVLDAAREHRVPVLPLVVNPGFNQDNIHKLLVTPEARAALIAGLIAESKKNGYIGFQFDFENIIDTDRDALSGLVREAAAAFHRQGLQLSIATVPNAPASPGTGGFSKWIYANWRGAYDLKAIGEAVDLLCLMTYDQHTRYTPPGPVAGYAWTADNLEYALKSVAKEKLSLGIPVYGYRWFAGDPKDGKPNPSQVTVGGSEVEQLVAQYHPRVQWDEGDRASWFYFYRDSTREWVFFTDARTFRERWSLANDRGIQGFCSWVLGKEDPAIWDVLPDRE